jgi:signal transduction histidine kinase
MSNARHPRCLNQSSSLRPASSGAGRVLARVVECKIVVTKGEMMRRAGKAEGWQAKPDIGRSDEPGLELATLLRQHQEEIAAAWAELVQSLPAYAESESDEILSFTSRGVAAMAEWLETGSGVPVEEYLAGMCPAGGEPVRDVSTGTEALLLCKDAAVPIIRDACGPGSSRSWALTSELDACLRWMVGRLTSMCAADMAQQFTGERAQVAMLLDMAQTVSSTLELHEVVRRVAEAIVTTLGVDHWMFQLVDEERGGLVHLVRSGEWASRHFEPYDSHPRIVHELLTTQKPVTCYDVLSDPRFDPRGVSELGAKSAVGVPLLVKGEVVAVVWPYTVDHYRRFSQEEIALAQGMGNMLGLVIRNAQLYEQSKLLAATEERARLSREIHDGVAQTLGALQLKASQLDDSLASQSFDESRCHLSELQEMISRAYLDLREAMFDLRAVVQPGTDLVTVLREYAAHYEAEYGLEVRLEAREDQLFTLDGETQAQAMRIVQEALRNVRRHAGTGSATLRIERHGGGLRIRVVDEGQGFDASLFDDAGGATHLGLRAMRERTASVGGTLSVESLPGQGTTVDLQLPLYEDRGPK